MTTHQKRRATASVCWILPAATVALAATALWSGTASANLPTGTTNHSAYAVSNCQITGGQRSMVCTNPASTLRAGPGTDYALHGMAIGGGWDIYKVVSAVPQSMQDAVRCRRISGTSSR